MADVFEEALTKQAVPNVSLKGKPTHLFYVDGCLYADTIINKDAYAPSKETPARPVARRALQISLDDAYGVRRTTDDNAFVVYSTTRKESGVRKLVEFTFNATTGEAADAFVKTLKVMIATGNRTGEIPRRHVLMLINPFGGTKKALKIFDRIVQPMCEKSHVALDVVRTTHAGHALEHVRDMESLDAYDAIVTVSGDGLLHECLNGVMQRKDWQECVKKIPFGIIPAGSGNAMAKTIDVPEPIAATHNLIKGIPRGLDILSIRQQGLKQPLYAHLLFCWGLIADVDIESEKYRWAGEARFTFSGLGRIMSLRKYNGRVTYLPWDRDNKPKPAEANADGTGPKSVFDEEPNLTEWKEISGDFVSLLAMNTGWQGLDVLFGPFSDISDGAIDLSWILAGKNAKMSRMLGLLMDTTKPPVGKPGFAFAKARAIAVESTGNKGIFDVDGEVIKNKPILVDNHRCLAQILAPKNLDMPAMSLDDLPPEGLETQDLKQATSLPSLDETNDGADTPASNSGAEKPKEKEEDSNAEGTKLAEEETKPAEEETKPVQQDTETPEKQEETKPAEEE
eukprot:m.18786 g.18786  ORF g.18786 m.18786 type:complete len:567 (-) comp6400_c0_seq1:150-1850(-)